MICSALETGRERLIKKKVVMSMNRHFILEPAEMKNGVGHSRVAVEGGLHKFPQESKRGDFPRQWWVGGPQPVMLHSFQRLLAHLV